jgi:hypothetical protein
MLERQYETRLRIVIAHDSADRASARVGSLLEQGVDLVLIHVRSLPVVPNTRLVAKEFSGRAATLRLNPRWPIAQRFPALGRVRFDYELRSGDELGEDDTAEGSYHRGSLFNQLNVFAGALLGVAGEAIQEIGEEILEAVEVLRGRGMPVAVLGPTPSTQSGPGGRWICDRLNRGMRSSSTAQGFRYVDLYPGWDDAFLMWDGLHLTPAGHRHVAERIGLELGEVIAAAGRRVAGTAEEDVRSSA